MYSGAEAGLPWTVSLLLESDLYKYSQALEGGWSPIPLDIILTEADLYLLWRLPHLPSDDALIGLLLCPVNINN